MLLFVPLEMIPAWNKGKLKQRFCSSAVGVLLHCVPLRANPGSSQSCVLEELHVLLLPQVCSVNQAVLLHSKAAILSACTLLTLLPWFSCAWEFIAGSYSTHVASVGLWFWQHVASLLSNAQRAVGVLKRRFAGVMVIFQAMQGKEGRKGHTKVILCFSRALKSGAKPSMSSSVTEPAASSPYLCG